MRPVRFIKESRESTAGSVNGLATNWGWFNHLRIAEHLHGSKKQIRRGVCAKLSSLSSSTQIGELSKSVKLVNLLFCKQALLVHNAIASDCCSLTERQKDRQSTKLSLKRDPPSPLTISTQRMPLQTLRLVLRCPSCRRVHCLPGRIFVFSQWTMCS